MARYSDLDCGWLTKYGFGLGVSLFVLGAIVGPALFGSLSGKEETLFVDSEIVGIVFLSVIFFAIVLLLTEQNYYIIREVTYSARRGVLLTPF